MGNSRHIIHVDMDAFYAAVEVRDDPSLAGKPLIIGSLPDERGVVSTCSYEARRFGVHSAMNIKEAYRLCPEGIYMHPNMGKYKAESARLHEIWERYTDIVEYVAFDEGYLDVTGSTGLFGEPVKIAESIKKTTFAETKLRCSVGVGFSMSSAKLASEEKKPDGLFVLPDRKALMSLIADRDVRVVQGVGRQTAKLLYDEGIFKVRDIWTHRALIVEKLGKHGTDIVNLSCGIDDREVTPSNEREAKSISREHTFQKDTSDREYLNNVLFLIARDLSLKLKKKKEYCRTVTLKLKFYDMKSVTRSATIDPTDNVNEIHALSVNMLEKLPKRAIRLIGLGVSNFTDTKYTQLSFDDINSGKAPGTEEKLEKSLMQLRERFGDGIIKTGREIEAENKTDNKR